MKTIRVRGKNFIIYHFLVESKTYERIDLLIYLTKKEKKHSNSNEHTFLKEN